jgi:cyclic pyranopterin phosphate synthase
MVDVGEKSVSLRRAKASGVLSVTDAQMKALAHDEVAKGDWQSVARLGGVQAAKRCAEWIPLCHAIGLDFVELEIHLDRSALRVLVFCTVSAHARTGVEMEALCGVTAALLCVYDMIKSMDKGARIESVALDQKSGGRSGDWQRS